MRRFPLLLLLGARTAAAHASAQERLVRRDLTIHVIDSATAQPIWGAQVRLLRAKHTAVTATDGSTTLPLSVRDDTLVVTRIGYGEWRRTTASTAGDSLLVPLRIDPLMLEALRATGRAAPSVSERVLIGWHGPDWGLGAAERQPVTRSTLQLLEDRLGFRRVPCPAARSPVQMEPYCTVIRGTPQPVRVFVDEQELRLGLDDLALYPLHEIRYVDVNDSREIVYVVTNGFAIGRARAWLHQRTPPR